MSDQNPDNSADAMIRTSFSKLSAEDFQAQCAKADKEVYKYQDRRYEGEVRGILKALFEYMQVDLSITRDRWNRLMDTYLRGLGDTGKTKVEERSSLNKILQSNPNMTLVTFYKALSFLRVVRVKFSVRLVFLNGITTEHGVWFDVNNPSKMTDEDMPGELAERVPVMQAYMNDPRASQEILPTQDDVQLPNTTPPPLDLSAFSRSGKFGQPAAPAAPKDE